MDIINISPLYISLKTSLLSTAITFFLGILVAFFVYHLSKFKNIIDGILTLPLVLPPTSMGFFLLVIFGKNCIIGQFLKNYLGITIIFSWFATVIAAFVVSFPLMYRTVRAAFEQIDSDYINAARTLGLSEWKIFLKVLIPLSWKSIIAGTILSFARSLGEFGATIMLAGNIPGKTQTMSLAIYQAVQMNNLPNAYFWATIIALWSLLVIVLMNYWSKKQFFVNKEV